MTAVPRIVIGTPDGGKQDTIGGRLKIQRGEGGGDRRKGRKRRTQRGEGRRRRETQESREMRVNPPTTEKER